MTPQRAKSCTCEAPHLQLEDETRVVYCHRCGRQVRPRAEASVLEAIRRASTEAVAGLDRHSRLVFDGESGMIESDSVELYEVIEP